MNNDIKTELHQLIDNCSNELLLQETKALLQSETGIKDWWDELTEEDKNSVLKSETEYEKGQYMSHDELINQFEEWKKK